MSELIMIYYTIYKIAIELIYYFTHLHIEFKKTNADRISKSIGISLHIYAYSGSW